MIYYRCPHCNRPYSQPDSDGSKMGKEATCNGDVFNIDKGCGKTFKRVKTKEKLLPFTTKYYQCFTVWNIYGGLIGAIQKCGEGCKNGCGEIYHGFEWVGEQSKTISVSQVIGFFSFGLLGNRHEKCPRCFSNNDVKQITIQQYNDQIVVSNSEGRQEWHNQGMFHQACFKCQVAWCFYSRWRA